MPPPHKALFRASSNHAPSPSQAMNLVSSTTPPLEDLGGAPNIGFFSGL